MNLPRSRFTSGHWQNPGDRRAPAFVALSLFLLLTPFARAVDLPLRINAGGPTLGKPGQSDYWVSDRAYAKGGAAYKFGGKQDTSRAENPGPAEVYQTVRHKDHQYRITGLPAGRYLVRFHFTDKHASNDRAMDYLLNGKLVIDNLNIYGASGAANRAHIIEAVTEVNSGEPLVIDCLEDKGLDVFEAGIEVLPASGKASPVPPASAAAVAAPAAQTGERSAVGAAIENFTGARTRVAWTQADKGSHYTDSKDKVSLMVFDSADNQGERELIPEAGAWSKPLITPGGGAVVFSDRRKRHVYSVNWDGTGLRDLGEGFASDVWRDPKTGHDWVYLRRGKGEFKDPIVRRRLDKPDQEEMVWDRTHNGHKGVPWFQLSEDGTRFADAFPWSRCGAGRLDKKPDWDQYGQGCWPGMAPDNSYRLFIFAGNHVHLSVYDDGGRNPRVIHLSKNIPGQKGRQVYFPRWSNHPRFLTVSSPEKDPKAELYLGKFDDEWKSVESWVRLTHNNRADLFGDAWIDPRTTSAAQEGTPAARVTLLAPH